MLMQADFIAYDLGLVDDATRDRIDAHLLACSTCLQSYLQLKRHLAQRAAAERPSEAMRLRLRQQVQTAFQSRATARFQRWMRRPIPLYQGLATAAALALIVGLSVPLLSRLRSQREERAPVLQAENSQHIDSSRFTAENLTIY